MGNPPQPVTSSYAWEPLALTGGTDIELPHEGPHANKGIVDRFSAIRLFVNQTDEVLDIRTRRPPRKRSFSTSRPNRPVVQITQTFRVADTIRAEDDLAVETAGILFPADRYELRYVMDIR